jgi:hypothetical protein
MVLNTKKNGRTSIWRTKIRIFIIWSGAMKKKWQRHWQHFDHVVWGP